MHATNMHSFVAMDNSRLPFLGVFITMALIAGAQQVSVKPPCNYPAIYNFGDSNSDTGASSAAFFPIPAPNGESFFQKPAGRVCDGRLIIDFIAEHLGLPYLNPYLDSLGSGYRHGANFAIGGSTIRRSNESISPFFLEIQTVQFDQFQSRTSDLLNQAKTSYEKNKLPLPKEFSQALYTIDIGQNDLLHGFRHLSDEQLRAAIPNIVDRLAASVTHLYQHGGRTFWIHNTGPIGCWPLATLHIHDPKPGFIDQYGCVKSQNEMAMEFNRQLKARVARLRPELPLASLVYVDVYAAKYRLIRNSNKEGFTDPRKICCGHHEGNIHVWCGENAMVNRTVASGGSCTNPSMFISWDGVHYSQAANHWISDRILVGSFSDPPIPITHACYKH